MSPADITAKAQAQATAERDALIAELRNRTALARLNQSEAVSVFDEIAALGFTLTKVG